MRYNIIRWDLTASPRPELLTDVWEPTKKRAIQTLKNDSYPNERGIIIDFKYNMLIAELKSKKITLYQP